MWMTLLYIVAVAVVAVIVAIAVLYAVALILLAVSLLFGFNVGWKKRKFLVGLIPDDKLSAEEFAGSIAKSVGQGFVEGAITAASDARKKKRLPPIEEQTEAEVEVTKPKRIEAESRPIKKRPQPPSPDKPKRRRPPEQT